jgi:hypothetical protein
MSKIEIPEFRSYEEEAMFWDNLDTGDFMEEDGEWFHFDVTDDILDEREAWFRFAAEQFQAAYGEDEPEYTLDMIREPNPAYQSTNLPVTDSPSYQFTD